MSAANTAIEWALVLGCGLTIGVFSHMVITVLWDAWWNIKARFDKRSRVERPSASVLNAVPGADRDASAPAFAAENEHDEGEWIAEVVTSPAAAEVRNMVGFSRCETGPADDLNDVHAGTLDRESSAREVQ